EHRKKRQLCVECGKMVLQLSAHRLTHTQEKQFSCPHCPMKMKSKGNICRHIEAVHLKKPAKTCETCGREFVHANMYKYHMRAKHGFGEPFECTICNIKFRHKGGLRDHMLSHTKEPKFSCQHCPMTCSRKSYLKLHVDAVHKKRIIKSCEMCDKGFSYIESYEAHMRSKHNYGESFECTICNIKFRHKGGLRGHNNRKHNDQTNCSCDICGMKFQDKRGLRAHGRVHSDEKPFACQFCPKRFKSPNAHRTHELIHKGVVFPCTMCDKTYTYKSLLNMHRAKHNLGEYFECKICSKKFRHRGGLNGHLNRKHNEESNCTCPLCPMCGKLVYDLPVHIVSHTKERKHVCPHCSMAYGRKTYLKMHVEAVHLKKVVKTCELCNRGFTQRTGYEAHMVSHNEKSNCSCPTCGMEFQSKVGLKNHSRVHSVVQMFACKHCPKRFKSPNAHKQHELTHLGVTFPCPVCAKTYRYGLKKHGRVHSNEQPFACRYCPKRFKSPNAHRAHELIHQGVVFTCEYCKKTYRYKSLLNMHKPRKPYVRRATIGKEQDSSVKKPRVYKKRPNRNKLPKKLCTVCGKFVAHLNHHLLSHTKERRFPCTYCPRAFSRSSLLKVHVETVHLKKTAKSCELCDRSFSYKSSYTIHMKHGRVHSNEQPFACRYCPKRFKSPNAHRAHELIHQGVVFTCEYCEKTYRYKSLLNMHLRVHGIGKTFDCHMCAKKFNHNSGLKSHIARVHSNERKFECETCGMLFKVK
ncbi:AGAP011418-PA, partial [Anopheles gambiae str. PEST]